MRDGGMIFQWMRADGIEGRGWSWVDGSWDSRDGGTGREEMSSYRVEAEGMKPVREKTERMNNERIAAWGVRDERVRVKWASQTKAVDIASGLRCLRFGSPSSCLLLVCLQMTSFLILSPHLSFWTCLWPTPACRASLLLSHLIIYSLHCHRHNAVSPGPEMVAKIVQPLFFSDLCSIWNDFSLQVAHCVSPQNLFWEWGRIQILFKSYMAK